MFLCIYFIYTIRRPRDHLFVVCLEVYVPWLDRKMLTIFNANSRYMFGFGCAQLLLYMGKIARPPKSSRRLFRIEISHDDCGFLLYGLATKPVNYMQGITYGGRIVDEFFMFFGKKY